MRYLQTFWCVSALTISISGLALAAATNDSLNARDPDGISSRADHAPAADQTTKTQPAKSNAKSNSDDEPTLDQMLDLPGTEGESEGQRTHQDEAPPKSSNQSTNQPTEHSEGHNKETDTASTNKKADGLELLKQAQKQLQNFQDTADQLQQAITQMGDVTTRLTKAHDPTIKTQRLQQQIIRKLDQTIAAAKRMKKKKQGSAGKSKSSKARQPKNSANPANQPASQNAGSPTPSKSQTSKANKANKANQSKQTRSDSTSEPSTGSADNQTPLSELRREWGQLPARLRNELSDGLEEPFSPVYRRMTEAYYRRLAKESGK